MRLMCSVCLLCLIIQTYGRKCGIPGKLVSADVHPSKDVYNEGDEVIYTCKSGYYSQVSEKMFKETRRTCQCNGTWNGTSTACNYYDYLHNNTNNDGYWKELFDDNRETCHVFNISQSNEETFNFSSQLSGTLYTIVKLGSIIDATTSVNMSVHFLDSSGKICERNLELISTDNLLFTCGSTYAKRTPHKVKIYLLAPKLRGKVSISVCSLKVIQLKERKVCGFPDGVVNGYVENSETKADYFCNNGYALRGLKDSTCTWHTPSGGYAWVSKKPPVCVSEKETSTIQCRAVKLELTWSLPSFLDCRDSVNLHGNITFLEPSCPQGNDRSADNPFDIAFLQVNTEGENKNYTIFCNQATDWSWSLNASRFVPIELQNSKMHTDKKTVVITVVTFGSFLAIWCIIYIVYRYLKNKHHTATPEIKQAEPIYCDTFVLRESTTSLSGANPTTYTNPSPIHGTAIFAEDEIYAPPTSPSTSVQHYFENDELYAAIAKKPIKSTSYKNCNSVIFASSQDCLYAVVNKPKDKQNKKPHAGITHYFRNDEVYASVTKTAKTAKKNAHSEHERDDPYASLKHRSMQTSHSTALFEHYCQNGETYAQVNTNGKKKPISNFTMSRNSIDLHEPLYSDLKDEL